MPMSMCASCTKMISISRLPGGNPIAQRYPDMYATAYGKCPRCGRTFCDGCIDNAGGTCPDCGVSMSLQSAPPGESTPMPAAAQELLDRLDAESARPAPRRGDRTKPSGLRQLVATLVFLGVCATILYALQAIVETGFVHDAAGVGLSVVGIFTLGAVVAPLAGMLITGTIGELLRRVVRPARLYRVDRAWMFLYLVALVASPVFIYLAVAVWDESGWTAAWYYAAIAGALVGGLRLLAAHTADLKTRIGG